eukprot:COSAG02_NODE_36606_length_452_cov_1.739377_1_plen_129_part_01
MRTTNPEINLWSFSRRPTTTIDSTAGRRAPRAARPPASAMTSRSTMHSVASSLPHRVLLLLAMEVCTAAATKPIADCASLARASLGPNVTVLSAQETTVTTTTTTADDHLAAGTCTFENDVDVGQTDTI